MSSVSTRLLTCRWSSSLELGSSRSNEMVGFLSTPSNFNTQLTGVLRRGAFVRQTGIQVLYVGCYVIDGIYIHRCLEGISPEVDNTAIPYLEVFMDELL